MIKTNTWNKVLKEKMKELTPLSDPEIEKLLLDIPVKNFEKGEVILRQGDKPSMSYYVIKGCVRQYASDENGKEVTLDFYIEEQAINMFSYADDNGFSRYSLACLEESILVACSDCDENEVSDDSVELINMKQFMFQQQFSAMQKSFTDYKVQKPEERFNALMKDRPNLIERVPQHIMASYLGITPETFSRFKKRMNKA